MARLPDERMSTVYEWTVEEINETEEGRDIIEVHFFDEADRAGAEAFYAQLRQSGQADFGLMRRRGNDADGETDRGYAYRDEETGQWPDLFDDGAAVPARFFKAEPRS